MNLKELYEKKQSGEMEGTKVVINNDRSYLGLSDEDFRDNPLRRYSARDKFDDALERDRAFDELNEDWSNAPPSELLRQALDLLGIPYDFEELLNS